MTAGWEERARVSEENYQRDPARYAGDPSDFARWAIARLKPLAGMREVIELGCGPGRDSGLLVSEGFRVRAIDFAPTAVGRAIELRRLLAEPYRSRLSVLEGEATQFLEGRPPASADAVFAHLVYATLDTAELTNLFRAVHRVLRPGGCHVYAVRDTSDPNVGEGVEVAPGTFHGGPHAVPYHYFTIRELDGFSRPLFEREELFRPRGAHLFYVLDRRRSAPPGTETPSTAGGG